MAGAELQHVTGGVGRNAEQSGMTERYQTGIADQDIQSQCKHREEQNLTADIDVIDAGHPEGQGDQHHQGDGKRDEAKTLRA